MTAQHQPSIPIKQPQSLQSMKRILQLYWRNRLKKSQRRSHRHLLQTHRPPLPPALQRLRQTRHNRPDQAGSIAPMNGALVRLPEHDRYATEPTASTHIKPRPVLSHAPIQYSETLLMVQRRPVHIRVQTPLPLRPQRQPHRRPRVHHPAHHLVHRPALPPQQEQRHPQLPVLTCRMPRSTPWYSRTNSIAPL